jgi:hypothetical protein
MFDGDRGPLSVTRTETMNGLAPSSAKPLREEFPILEPLKPRDLVPKAKAFLSQLGINKDSELGNTPCLILVGEPRKVMRNGTEIVVWKILNAEVSSWGRLTEGPEDKGLFDNESWQPGLYTGDPLGAIPPVYVQQSVEEAQGLLNDITAMVINGGIVFNTHSPGWAVSVYHEILHTFEHALLSGSFFFKEGFVEWFAVQFMRGYFGVNEPYYPPYALAARNVEKVIEYTSVKDCAKAYFTGDIPSASKLIPLFYKPIIEHVLKPNEKLEPSCVQDALDKCPFLKDAFSQYKMKKGEGNAAWYKSWVAKNGVPKGGPLVV